MTKSPRVFNLSRHYYLKHERAVQGVQNCAFAWVEFGLSVRDLTLAESIAARNEQARKQEGLVYWVEGEDGESIARPLYSELPYCVYKPVESAMWSVKGSRKLSRVTNYFAMSL